LFEPTELRTLRTDEDAGLHALSPCCLTDGRLIAPSRANPDVSAACPNTALLHIRFLVASCSPILSLHLVRSGHRCARIDEDENKDRENVGRSHAGPSMWKASM